MRLEGKVALITGASGGLGGAVVRRFAAEGASLVLPERTPGRLQSLLSDIAAPVLTVTADLTDPAAVAQLVDQGVARFGRLDILVNLVGGFRGGTPVVEMDEADWDAMMTLNLKTAFLISRAALKPMLSQGSGKIVHVASRSGLQGTANQAAYAASKAGVIRLTESLAAEVRHQGINVNCVLPGTIDTVANRRAMPKADFSKWIAPDDLASVILFLCTDEARAIHGAAIPVYGRT